MSKLLCSVSSKYGEFTIDNTQGIISQGNEALYTNAGRDATGKMHADYIATKKKFTLDISYPDQELLSKILKTIKEDAKMDLMCTYWDEVEGTYNTYSMYAESSFQTKLYMFTEDKIIYEPITINFIEN